ncbi:MAG: amino acid adenylation domain-containing protein [Bacteroidales bacterium]|nr:amino acid adenylation domain-containing protein [Bacteroidales bacterium]
MIASELLVKLFDLGVDLNIEGDKLIIDAAPGLLTEELILEIRAHKGEILDILKLRSKNKIFHDINPAPEKPYYPLSSAQRRLYLLQQMEIESTAYNMLYTRFININFDKSKLEWVFRQLIARHESLRTSFEVIGDEPVQRVHKEVDFCVESYTIEKSEAQERSSNFIKAFDLSRAPLLRVAVFEVKGEGSLLMIDMHHIIGDGVSQGILEAEYQALYFGEVLPPLRFQYKDYSEWLNSVEHQERVKGHEEYWVNRFAGELPVLSLPVDYPRPVIQSHVGASVNFALSKEETKKIKSAGEQQGLTLYMSLLSAYTILLSRLSGQEDIIVGTPIAGRNHPDLEGIVGVFVNTLVIRSSVESGDTLKGFMEKMKQSSLEAFEHQDYPFEDLVEKVSVIRDLSRNPLFDAMFSLQNQSEYMGDISMLNGEIYTHESGISKLDLTLTAVDIGDQLLLCFEYCTKLYKPKSVERFIGFFKRIVNQIATTPEVQLSRVEVLSDEVRHQLLYEFNDTGLDYPREKTIHQLFEEQTERTPDRVSVCCDGNTMTYAELDIKANGIAQKLLNAGCQPSQLVGVMAERSVDLIAGILGVLKSGCAYLPLDSHHPKERNDKIINSSGIKVLLTNISRLQQSDVEVLSLVDADTSEKCTTNLKGIRKDSTNDLAYIIYTSGSTGEPKGVMVEHRNVVNFVFGMKELFEMEEGSVLLSLTTISFDIFGLEVYVPLLSGACMVIGNDDDQRDVNRINQLLEEYRVSVLQLTPSRLRLLLTAGGSKLRFQNVETLLLGGEELPLLLLEEARQAFKGKIYNVYGPTETTIWSTYKDVTEGMLSIGRPIINTQVRIFGAGNTLQPIGVAGELCILGDGVARGYYKNQRLTEEKFLDISDGEGERLRMYRTGDLARWLPDGNIEFLGRMDNQVKIRGYRIELGEIENAILKSNKIKECVVIVREDNGEKYLCAYVVCKADFDQQTLRDHLSKLLPDYMIPSYFVVMDELPLTANGKVNRKALPTPDVKASVEYTPPSNETEEKLVEIWSEVLNISKEMISVIENFFVLGGNSLKAILLINRIRKVFEVEVSLSSFMLNSTIQYLALLINGLSKKEYVSIKLVEKKEYYPISSVQKRFYIIQVMNPESVTFNSDWLITIPKTFSYEKASDIFNIVVERHDAFRTFFINHNNTIIQRVVDKVNVKIETYNIKKNEIDQFIVDFRKPFDLSKVPILKIGYIVVEDGDNNFILYNTHHIFTDRRTSLILEDEFSKIVNNEKLKPLKLQYKDYAEWQNSKVQQDEIKKQEKYWLEVFKSGIPQINLPTDLARPEIINWDDCYSIGVVYDNNYANKIRKAAENEGVSLFAFFLSVTNLLLNKISGNNDIVVGTFALGRNMVDLENIVGAFINTIAIRNTFRTDTSCKDFLKNTANNIIQATENQDYQFDELVDLLKVKRKPNREPIFDIVLTLTETDQELSLEKEEGLKHHIKTAGRGDLVFEIITYQEKIVLSIIYCDKLFLPQTIDRFIRYLNIIIDTFLNDVNINMSEIKLIEIEEITKQEREEVEFDI